MRILREETETAKEVLPVSFLTDMISKGWEEVGFLRESSAAIKDTYANTKPIEDLMQDLMDAYLVFIGQVELYLNKEKDISPDTGDGEKAEKEPKDEKEDIKVEPETKEVKPALPEVEFDIEPVEEIDADAFATPISKATTKPEVKPSASEPFEFFVDFDEPDMSEPRLSDNDLYGQEDSEFEFNKLKSQLRD